MDETVADYILSRAGFGVRRLIKNVNSMQSSTLFCVYCSVMRLEKRHGCWTQKCLAHCWNYVPKVFWNNLGFPTQNRRCGLCQKINKEINKIKQWQWKTLLPVGQEWEAAACLDFGDPPTSIKTGPSLFQSRQKERTADPRRRTLSQHLRHARLGPQLRTGAHALRSHLTAAEPLNCLVRRPILSPGSSQARTPCSHDVIPVDSAFGEPADRKRPRTR